MWSIVFVFTQKTAYEMRISDWSSDVCSSDLVDGGDPGPVPDLRRRQPASHRHGRNAALGAVPDRRGPRAGLCALDLLRRRDRGDRVDIRAARAWHAALFPDAALSPRSEEHTPELQSLMRISYAVFSLT